MAVRRGLLEGFFPGRSFAYGPFIEALGLLLSGTAQRRLRPLLWLLSAVVARVIRDLQIRAEKVYRDRDDERSNSARWRSQPMSGRALAATR